MGDIDIRFTAPAKGQSTPVQQQFNPQKGTKIETIFNRDGSKTEKVYDQNGNLTKESIFKDIDGDGKEDIYSVSRFYKKESGSEVETFIDRDGDGFNDEKITRNYDHNGRLKSETREIEEDINDVKNRPHLEHEIYNRDMQTHYSGIMMG